ncbi:TIM44-like domain-containing protein [Phenylobacterium sp.]|uniref:Tim44 domain-containing protein n=1 Tax=Phenylobacterium sp. TaxID=1871053 RepID=UPI0028113249|nr:TIM44-like domain-containing protein [Phenylobacterium sp.]
MNGSKSRLAAVLGVAFSLCLIAADTADAARRGGGFGSRGARTYQAPAATRTAPQPAQPIQRSMTPATPGSTAAAPKAAAPGQAARPAQPRRGGMMGGLIGGLLLGGLIGALLGNGFGAGMAGFMAVLFQLALAAGVVFLLMKLFRRRAQPAMAGGAPWPNAAHREAPQGFGASRPAPQPTYTPVTPEPATPVEIGVTGQDRDTFERLLMEIQDALGREDYGALRERTTPEVMGFLAEDLAQNATEGRRNEISGTTLLEADVAEAWREGDRDYATAAMRYQAIDVVRDRATGAVIEGDPARPTQTTELWTFVRQNGGPWKLSAIQEA